MIEKQERNYKRLNLFCSGIIIGIILCAFIDRCSAPADTSQMAVDTVYVETPVYVPATTSERIIDTITLIDTVEVVRDYYTKRTYTDTIRIDTTVTVVIHDTVYNNQITGRTYDAKKITYTLIDNPASKWQFGIGATVDYSLPNKNINFTVLGTIKYTDNSFIIGFDTEKKINVGYIRYF